MPNRPAPRKPAARPPSRPPRLKKPPRFAVLTGAVVFGVMVRCIGWAAFGAVLVVGGGANVRLPREPELKPPPTRASTAVTVNVSGIATDRITTRVLSKARARCETIMNNPPSPPWGRSTKMVNSGQKGRWERVHSLRRSVAAGGLAASNRQPFIVSLTAPTS
ncbi:hypothetical protein BN961_00823 [Afipia felis]|uniref:Uncharacterized protein n=1 Tax=Afipia felis TaxID=1035 RepID=A0A090N6T9_AFIFE|nr:hypothetical protein BN961_00823 [Afipia felis]